MIRFPLAALAAACVLAPAAGRAEQPITTAQHLSTIPLTITTAQGRRHRFRIEVAKTERQQQRGLMFRTDLKPDGGMLFWPYPPEGGAPQVATFWMHNTPSALDIIYIRADGTIAHIARDAKPFDDTPLPSGEPVGAVLELKGGRAAQLGISEGDRVRWRH